MRIITILIVILFIVPPLHPQEIIIGQQSRTKIFAGTDVVIPFGRLTEISDAGYGVSAGFIYNFHQFETGILSGFYYFNGKEEMTDSLSILPLMASAGYRYDLNNRFFIIPRIAAGGAIVILRQDPDNIPLYDSVEYKTETSFEPMVRGGAALGYRMQHNIRISVSADYASIYESSGMLQFLITGGSVTYLF